MVTSSGAETWRRWSVSGFGAVLFGIIVGGVGLTHVEWTTLHHLQFGIPILVTVGLVAFGWWLGHSELSPDRVVQIALWSVTGSVLLGLFASWEMYTHILEGDPFVQTLHEPLLGMTEGAAVGGIVGYYDARRKDQHLEAEQARQAIAASMDGIAILDEEGTYEVVNRAHAEIYGYDHPDAFVGETWHLCYTDEEAARIEDEVLSQLSEEGSWRGELTGRRRDGRSFPQELTLSERPTGGLVCVVRDITERKGHEERLRELHGITREFFAAETPEEITTEIVSVVERMLGYPLTAVWEYDADGDRLVPLTAAEHAAELAAQSGLAGLPTLEAGSVEMEIFQGEETVLVDDYQLLEDHQVADVPLGAVLFIPLGDHGLLSIGSPEPGAIDATDRLFAEILVSNASAAIDRVEREQELANREQRLRTIIENVPVILFAVDRNRELTLQVGKGLDHVGLEQNQMIGTTIEETFGDSPEIIDAVDRSLDGESVDVTVDIWGRTYQVWYQPIERGGAVANVIGVAMDVTERHRRERGIRELHDATRAMMQQTDRESICQIAVDTAQNALGLPISTIWLQSDDQPQLEPVAWSPQADDLFDELPVFEPGDSLSWQVFESGQPRVFDDVRNEGNRANAETEMRSELIVPIGAFGVMNSGATEAGVFDEKDVLLAKLLAANTRSALERAEREEVLERQTDEMEFFNSILRHDVLNGMTVIKARAEFLADDLDGDQLRDAETIIEWSNDVTTIINRVRTVLETLTGSGDPQLEAVDLSEQLRSEVERVRATYPEVTFETDVPGGVHVQANELLGEVLGNVITNAVDHNDTDGLCISVRVDDADGPDDAVTVQIADNGTGVPDDIKEAIFRREETGHAKSTGSGFGLFFVDSMVTEYDGDVRVRDNDPQGAEFVIELPTP